MTPKMLRAILPPSAAKALLCILGQHLGKSFFSG
jgi:hypothetical protein